MSLLGSVLRPSPTLGPSPGSHHSGLQEALQMLLSMYFLFCSVLTFKKIKA